MAIQWFPGHMTRARRQIQEKLKLIDIVIELLDARVPLSSRNPMIDEILQDKPRIIVLNKADLADPQVTEQWVNYFAEEGVSAFPIDASSGHKVGDILPKAKFTLADKIQRQINKGINPRAIRALIVGIPNVGKSTLINKMAGKNIAVTGDKPGVTKGQQWIKVGTEMELLDTPGILWPKFEDQQVGYRLAVVGSIKEEIIHLDDIAFYAIRYMAKYYLNNLQERFGIEYVPEDLENPNEVVKIMEEIGRKRGCIVSGGRVDLDKTSILFLRELRAGKLGRISFERPADQGAF
ncbi:GTPase [Paenibacillus swuensis]|uniref:Ribosome biogenesis GTPase A n=1 Tax=Paenibacillus swuensis TaxID=1178515 RepID=A0A172TKE7_9BACL|nr:ribosome biogenesis GTPase YlqF [Paenibacillus swuensis]ANE47521.1 GTPase [Paenibacillus swuensis]